jgi:hypothetical protein
MVGNHATIIGGTVGKPWLSIAKRVRMILPRSRTAKAASSPTKCVFRSVEASRLYTPRLVRYGRHAVLEVAGVLIGRKVVRFTSTNKNG